MSDRIEVMMKAKNCGGGHNLKRLLAPLFIAILLFSIAPIASAGWDYYRAIEIDNTQVSGSQDLSSFPVLIDHTAGWLKDSAHGGGVKESHGYDIVFTDADNTTLLDFEIEKYDGTAGTLVAWVRIPTLDYNENTTILLWYGNSAASDWSNAAGVWDTNYKGVWHLSETTGGTDAIKDSTSNDNDGTDVGSPNLDATGQIDGADDFDGSNEYVNVGSDNSLQLSGDFTIEAWIKTAEHSEKGIVGGYKATSPNNGYGLVSDSSTLCAIFNWAYTPTSNTAVTDNAWHHVAVTFTGTTAQFYLDGASDGSGTGQNPNPSNEDILIGSLNDLPITYSFNGIIDEVRISASARSGDWINTSHNNQNSPSTFYSVAATGTPTGGADPVPELPTVILFAVGLVVLVGYQRLERRRRRGKY